MEAPGNPLSPRPPTTLPQSTWMRTAVPIQDLTYPSSIDITLDLGGSVWGLWGAEPWECSWNLRDPWRLSTRGFFDFQQRLKSQQQGSGKVCPSAFEVKRG